jgi:hypothetical protein
MDRLRRHYTGSQCGKLIRGRPLRQAGGPPSSRQNVGDCVIEVWQDKFVLAADPGGVEYDAGQIDELSAARFKKRRAEASRVREAPPASI